MRHYRLLTRIGMAAVLLLSLASNSIADQRGVRVQLRASDSLSAAVSETVDLYGKSYALVIGNDNYTGGWQSLSNAVADAEEIAKELAERGFNVTFLRNLDAETFRSSLKEFFALKGADPEARLFLWYAGHGHTLKGEGYLVPSDAPQPITPQFKVKAIHMREFPGFMRLAESKHVFAVFDSCFAGTVFTTRAGGTPAAITRATTKPVRQFLTSGDADQAVSDDGTFRKLFLRALRGEERADANGDGYITGSEMGLYLADRVTNITEQAQTPRYGKLRDPDYDRGDFVFVLPGREESISESEQTESPADSQAALVDIVAWASIAASDDLQEFETYLNEYPEGRFSAAAKRKIEALKTAAAAPEAVKGTIEAEEEKTTLEITSGQEIVEATEEAEEDDWAPVAPSERKVPLIVGAQSEIEKGKSAKTDNGSGASMTAGSQVNPKDWVFSNPQGDGVYKAKGKWVHMKVGGGHNMWDCTRGKAPLLSVDAPKTDKWTAQVKFEMPSRVGKSHIGLMVWNGREERPVHSLYIGPTETGHISAGGSYRDDCSGGSTDMSRISGNTGEFVTNYEGSDGWLRISRDGHRLGFYFKSPFKKQWQELGTALVTEKDGLDKVGLMLKTWGNQQVQVSFSDFRLMEGVAGVPNWTPSYLNKLAQSSEIEFTEQDFASDFEWSDPQGDSLNEITADKVRIKAPGGHNLWDCNRGKAPMLTVEPPPVDTWTAQVKFDMPARSGRSHVGMVLWNGREDNPVHALYIGPSDAGTVSAGGSYQDDCSGGSTDMSRIRGNQGSFVTNYTGADGWLRISRQGDIYSFYFKSPHRKQWRKVGTVQATDKDGFSRIGLFAKTWGGNPVEVNFSNFKIAAGVAGVKPWIPSYFSGLNSGEPVVFSGRKFGDFEWSDPNGDSLHKINGAKVLLKVNGGHNSWDCTRGLAPMLMVKPPPQDTWVAQVDFSMPARVSRSHVGLALWNGADDKPVNLMIFGPESAGNISIAGSYQDDCSGGSGELAKITGNSGTFSESAKIQKGTLRIIKTGMTFRFSYRSAEDGVWHKLGSLLTTIKDDFNRIGLVGKTWGGEGAEVNFSNFTIVPGGWR